jgi:uncharacterized protein (TIGR02246 family)
MLADDEQQIVKLFEDGDRALIAADVEQIERIYADDYMQADEAGKISTRQELIDRFTSGAIRFLAMTSTGRRVRLLRDDVAVVHGSEEDEVEREGKRESVRYVYMDIVMKCGGEWRIVASQLTRG